MVFNAEQRRAALDAFMARAGLNVGGWEALSGLGEGTLRKFMDGNTQTLTDRSYQKLADGASKHLDRIVTVAELQGGNGSNVSTGITSILEPVQKSRDFSVTTLVLWKVALGVSGQQGAFVLSNAVVGELPRDERVARAKRAFACKLLDNANAPGYRAGHTIVVDPDTGPAIGDFCVFTSEDALDTGADTVAAFFVGHTATHWIIAQNVVPGEQKLSRKDYPQVWPAVVHYSHGP